MSHTYAHGNYGGQSLWCPILDGCNAVVNSPYSRIFGVPMSYFGFGRRSKQGIWLKDRGSSRTLNSDASQR
jgi:hypothetical protein